MGIIGGTAATGGTPKTASIVYTNDPGAGGPLELLTNASVYDLASDVQRALNTAFGSAALNPLLVGVDAGRLLITIKSGTAGLGATDFNILADSATAAEGRAITQLKLYNPTLAVPASVNLDANEWDLLITDSNGKVFGVDLDGDTTIGNVLAGINAAALAAGSDVVASIGPLGNGLQLEEASVGSGRLTVRTVNGSNAAIDLGIYLGGISTADATSDTIPDTAGLIIGDTIGTLALIDRVFLRQVDADTPIVGASFDITTDDPDTGAVEKINLEANFGFVGITATGEGSLAGNVGITLVNGDTGRTTLRDLFSAVAEDRNDDGAIDIDDFKEVVNTPSFTLEGDLDFTVTVSAGGGIEALITDIDGGTPGIQVGTFSIHVDGPGDPFAMTPEPPDVEVNWTAGDLGDLEQFANIDFGDVLGALKQLAGFLDDYAAFGFLNEEIPLIGISFNELVDLADRFRVAVEEIEQNPAGSMQLLEQKIREEFGLPPGVLTLELADGDDADTDPGDMLKIKFNLGGGFSESLPIAFGIPDDLIDGAPIDISLEGQADLNATGNLDALFTIGVDLNPGVGLAPVYLYTNESETKIGGTLTASANDLTFNAALGPVGVTIADGGASISLAAEFKSSDPTGTRVPLTSAFSAFDVITFSGNADAVLPVYFPTQSSYIGDLSLHAEFEATPSGGLDIPVFDVEAPDFTLDFESFSLFDNLGLLLDATDLFLRGVQDILDSEVLGFELPLIGDQLTEAAQFIEDFRGGFIKDLRNLVENAASVAAETVQGFLFDLLGPSGLNLLADTNGDSTINVNDVIIEGLETLNTPSLSDDYLQWNVLLGKTAPADVNLAFDLGFPALGLDGDFDFDVTVGWELGIGLGISIADGAYIDVLRQDYTTADPDDVLPELRLVFDVTLADTTNISGDLLFLQLDIDEAPRDVTGDAVADPTHFHAEFSVDLTNDGDAAEEVLPFSEIGNLEFDLDLDANAAVNLDLRLKFNEDLIGSSPLSAILPEITAHFGLYWEVEDALSGELELGDSLKYLAFEDISLDLGSFLGDLIVPVVDKIQDVTEPFQPIVDIVTAAIPVLSDLAGEPVTLADIAAAFGEFNPDLIYAIADLISLVNSIPTDVESLVIPFGDFVLIDVNGINEDPGFSFGGISAGDLSDPNFSFKSTGGSDPFSGAFTALNSVLPAINDLIGMADTAGGSTGNAVSGLLGGDFNRTGGDGQEYGFAFPLFEDPSQIFGLLVGRPATIVTYDLPPFVMDFSWKQSFPIYGPLWGVVTASVGMKIDLAFGYDTEGLSDFADSGFSNPLALLGGLYIADTDNPAGGGVDVPELVFTGSIGVGAELNAGIASAGVTANIILTVNFDFYDPDHDTKIRIDELISTFLYEVRTGNPALAPLAIFDISGDISLQLKAYIEFLFARFNFDITPPIVLFEFSIPFEREPFLATERDDGSLLLNIGDNAAARMNGDIRDLSEQICVQYIGGNQAKVWSDALGVPEGAAQIYAVDPNQGIFAYGGEGNDVIVVKGDIKLTAEGGSGDDVIVLDGSTKSANLRGGVGNDTLIGSGGADFIWGEAGDDIIHGRGGDDWLFGDFANITNGPTGSLRVGTSDEDGNDIIWGGGDDDIVFGGGGNDILAGDSDAIPNLTFAPFDACGVTIDLDAIASGGTAGDDFLFGDGGRIDSAGGTDSMLILALGGVVDTADQGRTKFAGIRLTDADGGGSDNLFGQVGDDVTFAGSGDDQADGGDNDDTIYGESGLDTLSGGADDDEIQGGLHKDTIFGFGPGPADPYNDGGSVAADGEDLLFGDDGNDLIRGNGNSAAGLGDTIYGGRGADVLFGDTGDDNIFGENEGDTIFGGADDDYVEGGTGNDTVFGDDGLVIYFAGLVDDPIDDRVIGDALAFFAGNSLFDYYDDTSASTLDDDADLTLDLMITYVRAGSDGDDTVIGGEGDDIAFGGAGDDTLFGDLDPVQWLAAYASEDPPPVPAGADTLVGDGGRIEWFGRRMDLIESFKGVDATEAGDDVISGNGGTDRLLGGGGSDDIYGRMPASFAGNAKLDEDVGVEPGKEISDNDIGIGDDGVIDFARGTTKLARIATTIYTPLAGETYVDDMFGNWGRDILLGGLAGDNISGDTGLTFSEPRSSDDIILGDNGELLYADNSIPANFGRLELIRTTDIVNSTGGADTVFGNEGDDVILGGVNGSIDVLNGNVGNDVILGDNGELDFALGLDTDLNTLDLIRSYRDGLGGIDIVSGNAGSDVLIGSTAGDEMYGDNATASAAATDGEDIMLGDNGDLFLVGTVGRLLVRVNDMPAGTAVDIVTTTDSIDLGDPAYDTAAEVEAVGGADTMSGNAQADIMLGGVNNGGIDIMYGDRTLPTPTTIANDGDDVMLGDNGLLDFAHDPDTDRNTLDLSRSFEDALGGTDIISGNARRDVAIGGTGDDTIYGDDLAASAGAADGGDLLVGDNADILLVDRGSALGGDLKIVLDAAVMSIRTTDEDYDSGVPANNTGGVDTISGNAGGDIIAGGVEGDTLYGDALVVVPNLDGNDTILGDNGAFEWRSTGRFAEITGIDISANNPNLFAKYSAAIADTDLTTLDLITTEQPNNGGRDTIYGDEANDLAFGGTDLDFIHGDDGNEVDAGAPSANRDVMFGDHGRLYPQFPRFRLPNSTTFVPANFPSRNFFAIDIGDADGGEGDMMWGEEGDDVMLGQQGDDRMWGGAQDDDMTGGHNVAGGYDELTVSAIAATLNPPVNDLMDGGSGDDAMAGDNAIVWRRGDDNSPRFRLLTTTSIYTTGPDASPTITTNVGAAIQSDPDDAVGRDVQLLDHSDAVQSNPLGRFGVDVMAGGADSDVMYGQLADDLMQGDGNIALADDGLAQFITRHITVVDSGTPDTTDDFYFNVPELLTDADDYMEGNGGSDLMYGGLGQDDIVGGSSALFGLTSEQLRPDGSDIIFGGAGAPVRLVRNDFVGATDSDVGTADGVGAVPTGNDPSIALVDRHSRDADFIMGDNANVFRLVNSTDDFRVFNYDQTSAFESRGSKRIVPRAMEQLDYTLGGSDYHGGVYVSGAAQLVGHPADNGASDLIYGESGDDYIFAMTGSDVVFGNSDDDDIIGGYGNDWISGGTGQDGVLGDDGLLFTSRNSTLGEPLYGIAGLLASDPSTRYSNGNVLDELITTPGTIQYAVINVTGELKKTADLVPFSFDATWIGTDDEFPDDDSNVPFTDDAVFGGLGSDFLHGGSGDDAISGAEALEHAYVPTFDLSGQPNGVLDLGYNAFDLTPPINPGNTVAYANPGDVLAFNPVDLDGRHLNNRYRAGEFFLYDEYNPLTKILLNAQGALWKPGDAGVGKEFLLNFDKAEGLFRAGGTVPKATGQQTETYGAVNDDGRDAIFGDLGNDWIVGGTGRDDLYGGWGNDLLNTDDDQATHNSLNDVPDTHPNYEDRAYGGAGRDVLIANTGGDRLIDWVGEYNSYLVPFAPFGMATVSRTMQPYLPEFLYALSSSDGADPTRYRDAIGGQPPAPTNNDPNPSRNGEPHGELGLVLQKDFAWQAQTGAPADPQAGNIPGGPRDVLRSASFSGPQAQADGFFIDSGSWTVVNGKYQVEPGLQSGDALSVFLVDKYIPNYFEVLSTLNAVKPTGGFKGNAYVIFDYQSPTNFKFAGINVSTNKLEVGHRTETGWVVDVQGSVQGSLQANKDYNVFLSVNGSAVTLLVDNRYSLSFVFQPRVDRDGYSHFAHEGMIGIGANNAKATIDNVAVQRVAPVMSFSKTVDFDNGTTTDLLQAPSSGTWAVQNGRYKGTAGATAPAIDRTSLLVSPTSLIDLSATLSITGEGGFIFDQYDAENFKFVTISAGRITIGHHTSRGWFTDATYSRSIVAGANYTLGLTLKGTTVSVTLNDQPVLSYAYNALVTDGYFGLFSKVGTTSFDSFTVKHD